MSPKYDRFIKLAVEEAKKSTYRMKVGSVIFKKKEVYAKAHNETLSWRKKLHPKFTEFRHSIHAEVANIIAAKRDLTGATLVVVRINKGGKLCSAKPCDHCLKYIRYVKIKRVLYSDKDRTIKELKL